MKKTTTLSLLALALAGCKVGPDYEAADPAAPAQFGAATRPATQPVAVDLTRWWTSLGDAQLTSLIERGARVNLDVQAAAARVRAARGQLGFNRAGLFPTLDANASYSRSRNSKNANTAVQSGGDTGNGGTGNQAVFGQTETDLFQAGFDAGWEIDVFGGQRRAVESAEYALQAGIEDQRNALVTVLAEIAQNYAMLRGYQNNRAIIRRNVAAQRDTVDLQRERLRAGIATDLTVAQAEALLAVTEALLPTLETQVRQSIHRLSVLLNEEPTALAAELEVPDDAEQRVVIPAGPSVVPAGLPSDLLRRRPDVRQAERQLAASTAAIGVATADYFPRFSLTGSVGVSAVKLTNLPNNGSVFYSVGPGVTWRLFDFGQIRANVAIASAEQEQALIAFRQSVLLALEDVENSLVAYGREQERRAALQRSVDANRRAVDLSRQLYDAGVVDFLNVLTAQQSLYESEDQLAQSDQAVSTSLIAVYKALGGGWESTEGYLYEQDRIGSRQATAANVGLVREAAGPAVQ